MLQGAPLAGVGARGRRPARPAAPATGRPTSTRSCTAGEVVWVGAGALGATDGRVRLVFRDQAGLLLPTADERARDPARSTRALLEHLGAARRVVLARAGRGPPPRPGQPYDDADGARRAVGPGVGGRGHQRLARPAAGLGRRQGAASGGRSPARPRPSAPRPPGPARARRPAPAAGRWSRRCCEPAPTPTEAAHARALQLLERYGVLTREAALGEGAEGGFAGVYPVLKALEERGQVRRGYFVAGLGAAQFALPGAVDRLRSARSGRAMPTTSRPGRSCWRPPTRPSPTAPPSRGPTAPGRPARAAGAHVVLADGDPVAYLERGGRSVVTFPAAADHPDWAESLVAMVKDGRRRSIEITRADGEPVRDTPVADRAPPRRLRRGLPRPRLPRTPLLLTVSA